MIQELVDRPNHEMMNTKETVIPELSKCYLRLMELPGTKGERTTGLLPIDGLGDIAVSVVEREYSGSESFAVFIYELAEPELLEQDCFERELADGRHTNVRLKDMIISNRCNYDTLHELCAMIDVSLEKYYEANIFCNR